MLLLATIRYISKNQNLYPHQSRIAFYTLPWDTLYYLIWSLLSKCQIQWKITPNWILDFSNVILLFFYANGLLFIQNSYKGYKSAHHLFSQKRKQNSEFLNFFSSQTIWLFKKIVIIRKYSWKYMILYSSKRSSSKVFKGFYRI